MKRFLYLIAVTYIVVYIIAFTAPVKTGYEKYLAGTLFSIVLYLIFFFGVFSSRLRPKIILHNSSEFILVKKYYALIAFISVASAAISIEFYTGYSFSDIINGLIQGTSNYNHYQEYFGENILGLPFYLKLTGIISLAFCKFGFIYLVFSYFLFEKNKEIGLKLVCVMLSVLSYVLFSLARGTSFELFELLMLIIFMGAMKLPVLSLQKVLKLVVYIFPAILVVIYFYEKNIELRYAGSVVDMCMTPNICLNENALLFEYLPSLANLLVKLTGYFGFPLQYMSLWIQDVFLSSWSSVLMFMLPGAQLNESNYPRMVCDGMLDCGASWSPFVEKLILSLGFFGVLVVVFIIGLFSGRQLNLKENMTTLHFVFLFYVFIFMLSLPVNDFIFSVSSNSIIFLSAILILLYKEGLFKFK